MSLPERFSQSVVVSSLHVRILGVERKKKVERGFGTYEVEWTGMVAINKEAVSGSGQSAHGYYLLTTPGFKGRNFDSSGFSKRLS